MGQKPSKKKPSNKLKQEPVAPINPMVSTKHTSGQTTPQNEFTPAAPPTPSPASTSVATDKQPENPKQLSPKQKRKSYREIIRDRAANRTPSEKELGSSSLSIFGNTGQQQWQGLHDSLRPN